MGDTTYNLYDKAHLENIASCDVRVMISKKKFVNGNFASQSDKAWINVYDTAGIGLVKLESLNSVLISE